MFEQARGKLTQREYCRVHRLGYASFARCRGIIRQKAKPGDVQSGFMPIFVEAALNDDERYAYRQTHAIPRLEALHNWSIANESKVKKESLTYKAIRYTLAQWSKLIAYFDHGQLRISNILTENAIRPFLVGR